jgi:hypothetical protein
MGDHLYKPKRNSKLLVFVLLFVGIGHVVLMLGADSVLRSIQTSLIGRKVIRVEIFGENRGKTAASESANDSLKQKTPIPTAPKSPVKPAVPKLESDLPLGTKPTVETEPLGSGERKGAATEGVPSESIQATEATRMTNSIDPIDVGKKNPSLMDTVNGEIASEKSVVTADSALPKIELPKVGVLKAPQNYVFVVFQGDAADATSVGKINFDLEVNNLAYQSRFAIRFNWVTRLIAEDREWISQGLVGDVGLKPQKIIEQRGKRPPKTIALDYEKSLGKIAESSFPIQLGLQDRTSIIWQFSLLAKSNPDKYARGAEFDFPLLVSSKMIASKWRSKLETIQVGGRNVEAIHFVRTDQRDDDVRFEFWLGAEFDMSPVKLTISDGKGRKFDVVREKVS